MAEVASILGNPGVKDAVHALWQAAVGEDDAMSESAYFLLHYNLHGVLKEDCEAQTLYHHLKEDWERDCASGGSLGFDDFAVVMLNLAAEWVDRPRHFAVFLQLLCDRVLLPGCDPPVLRVSEVPAFVFRSQPTVEVSATSATPADGEASLEPAAANAAVEPPDAAEPPADDSDEEVDSEHEERPTQPQQPDPAQPDDVETAAEEEKLGDQPSPEDSDDAPTASPSPVANKPPTVSVMQRPPTADRADSRQAVTHLLNHDDSFYKPEGTSPSNLMSPRSLLSGDDADAAADSKEDPGASHPVVPTLPLDATDKLLALDGRTFGRPARPNTTEGGGRGKSASRHRRPVKGLSSTQPLPVPSVGGEPSVVFQHPSGLVSELPPTYGASLGRSMPLQPRKPAPAVTQAPPEAPVPSARPGEWSQRTDTGRGFEVGGSGVARGGLGAVKFGSSEPAPKPRRPPSSPTHAVEEAVDKTGMFVKGGGAGGRVVELVERSQVWEGGITKPPYLKK